MRFFGSGGVIHPVPDHAGHGDGVLHELASFLVVEEGTRNKNLVRASGVCNGGRGLFHLSLPSAVRRDYGKRIRVGSTYLFTIGEHR